MVAPSVWALGSTVTCPVPLSARPTHTVLPFPANRRGPGCGEPVGGGVGEGEGAGDGDGDGDGVGATLGPFPEPATSPSEFLPPQPSRAAATPNPSTKVIAEPLYRTER
jgi:hypothetical protein